MGMERPIAGQSSRFAYRGHALKTLASWGYRVAMNQITATLPAAVTAYVIDSAIQSRRLFGK